MAEKSTLKIDILRDLVHYHENILEYEQNTIKLFSSFSKDIASIAWRNYYEFFTVEIVEHFDFEENVVFPAFIINQNNESSKQFIKQLIIHHKEIKSKGAKIFTHFSSNKDTISTIAIDLIKKNLLKFATMIKKHTQIENEKLLPIVESNSQIRFLMGRALFSYKSAYKERYIKSSNNDEEDI